jgi:hypothetical protein
MLSSAILFTSSLFTDLDLVCQTHRTVQLLKHYFEWQMHRVFSSPIHRPGAGTPSSVIGEAGNVLIIPVNDMIVDIRKDVDMER